MTLEHAYKAFFQAPKDIGYKSISFRSQQSVYPSAIDTQIQSDDILFSWERRACICHFHNMKGDTSRSTLGYSQYSGNPEAARRASYNDGYHREMFLSIMLGVELHGVYHLLVSRQPSSVTLTPSNLEALSAMNRLTTAVPQSSHAVV
jgi:hypothetical protein